MAQQLEELSHEYSSDSSSLSFTPIRRQLHVLFENDSFWVFNKPMALVCNATETTDSLSLSELYEELGGHLVHRLDRDTTGVLLLAKNAQAAAELSEAFAERRVRKQYLALCEGEPEAETIDAPIGLDKRRPRARAIRKDGKPAQTHFKLLAQKGPLSLVQARPLTGRTHQIRIHLAELDAPIFGDTLYGGRRALKVSGQIVRASSYLLHAQQLIIPWRGKELCFKAPMPAVFIEHFPEILDA